MRDRLASSILLAAAAAAALGCAELKDAYGKEYVLYDSRRAAHAQPAGATGEADARGARDQAGRRADDRTDDEAGPQDTDEASFARLVQLEHVRGEIERAILDGLDEGGDLARKRRAIDAEIAARAAALGERLDALRRARVAELRSFEVEGEPTR